MKILTLICVFLLLTGNAHSTQEWAGAKFPLIYRHETNPMVLKGTGLKRMFFIKAFAAGCYLAEGVQPKDVLSNVPKRIQVKYFVNIPGMKLTNYTKDMMRKNIAISEYKKLSPELERMASYFVDLKPGDTYALTYIPGTGTQFEYNGKIVGTIEGEKFAKAIFSVWLGERPMDHAIKQQILGLS